jgi:hypothetical protein
MRLRTRARIDECHNVAARAGDQGVSRRARLARMLATRSDTLMLLSATPHDGSARSFASLMSLLDPTAISDPDDYTPEDSRHKGLVVRRFKKDIRDQVPEDFPERTTMRLTERASAEEEDAYRALLEIPFTQGGEHRAGKQQALQRVGMQKALFSSPAAALESTLKRIDVLNKTTVTNDERKERRRAAPHQHSGFQQIQPIETPPTGPVIRVVTGGRRRSARRVFRAPRDTLVAEGAT